MNYNLSNYQRSNNNNNRRYRQFNLPQQRSNNFNRRIRNINNNNTRRRYRNNWFNNMRIRQVQLQPRLQPQLNFIPNFVARQIRNQPTNNQILRSINTIKNEIKNDELPKVTNVFRNKKEMRTDKLISALEMTRYHDKLSFYQTNLKVTKYAYYQKFDVTITPANNKTKDFLLWFPYFYPDVQTSTKISSEIPNRIVNFYQVGYYPTLQNENKATLTPFPTVATSLVGQARLIAATMRITPTTSQVKRAGTYTAYKVLADFPVPFIYSTAVALNPVGMRQMLGAFLDTPFAQIIDKQLFSANDTSEINEFNVNTGNNMFAKTTEYLGQGYSGNFGTILAPTNDGDTNPIGTNIKYLIEVPTQQDPQTYAFEAWYIYDVAPSAQSNLGGIAEPISRTFNKAVCELAAQTFPFNKVRGS